MNRRDFLKLIGIAVVAPSLPKAEVVDNIVHIPLGFVPCKVYHRMIHDSLTEDMEPPEFGTFGEIRFIITT